MGDLLSQEEIDALLNAGFGGSDDDDDEPSPAFSAPKTPSTKSHQFPDFPHSAPQYTPAPLAHDDKRKLKLKRSPKVESPVNIQPAVFQPFDEDEDMGEATNMEVILNLDLEIRVELGKTRRNVRDILELGSGSMMELNKLNGEPVDLMVNQKQFAKGEMIVIGENFGVRVTDILSVTEIIEALR